MGKNIEIVPCAIREQRIVRHYNILKTTSLRRYYPAPGGSLKDLSNCRKPLKIVDFKRFLFYVSTPNRRNNGDWRKGGVKC